MKYSQLFGAILCLALVGVCTLPWSYIEDINIVLSGVNGYVNATLDFGKQIITHSFFGGIMFILF